MNSFQSWVVSFAIFLMAPFGYTNTFNIAAIVATGDHQSPSAREKICVYEGMVKNAMSRGLPVRLKLFDNERSPLKSEEAAHLIVATDVNVVLGSLISSEALPAAEVLENAEIPFVVNGTTPELTMGRSQVVGLFANDYTQAVILAEYAEALKPKHVIIVQNASIKYSIFLASEFAAQLLSRLPDTRITTESIFKNYPLFGRLANIIVNENPDIIFTPLYNPNIAQLYNALDEAGNTAELLGSDSVGGRSEFYNFIGTKSKNFNLLFVRNSSGKYVGDSELFYQIHEEACRPVGIKPSYVGAAAFDVINSVLKMVELYGVVPRSDVVKKLKAQPYFGLLGQSSFQQGGTRKTLYLFKVGEGENELVKNL